MKNGLNLISGIGLGAGLMYVVDPEKGRRRRAILRDKMVRALHVTSNGLEMAVRDLQHRTTGLAAKTRHGFQSQKPISDEILTARIRTKLGRHVSHPHAIEVSASNGEITVRGPIFQHEVNDLLSAVHAVPGVTRVHNRLEPHRQADAISSLQGGREVRGERFELMQTNWSPAARLLVMLASGTGIAYGLFRRGTLGWAVSLLSSGPFTRALTNLETKRLLGIGGRKAITVHKTMTIHCPIDQVYDFFGHFDNFDKFLPDILDIRQTGDNRYHWRVVGPLGVPVVWDATITRREPNRILAWQSEPGSIVQNAGRILFEQGRDGTTRINMDISYNPPAGALGHLIARLFGADPKSKMDKDLMRIKSMLESGKSEIPIEEVYTRVSGRS